MKRKDRENRSGKKILVEIIFMTVSMPAIMV